MAVIYYFELLPSAFVLAFDIAVPAVAVAHGSLCSPFNALLGNVSVYLNVSSLLEQVAYSVDAQDLLGPVLACMIYAKPAVY